MFYSIAHFLRDRMPFLWDLIDILNSILFSIRYGRNLQLVENIVFEKYSKDYKIVRLRDIDTNIIVSFFDSQPEEAYKFFRPHGFDDISIRKLKRNKSFLAYFLLDEERIAAYCFNRSFFFGKGFRGRMVSVDYRGRGLGTMMNKILNEVGFGIGIRLFETVNIDNVASYKSAVSASKVKVLEEREDGDLYLEILKD